ANSGEAGTSLQSRRLCILRVALTPGGGYRARADLRTYPSNGSVALCPYLRSRPMAGGHTLGVRSGQFAVALAIAFLTFADLARAQYPSTPAATPARSYAGIVEPEAPPVAIPTATAAPGPSYYPGGAPAATRVAMRL